MYSLKVIAHSASGKSILASVSKKVGIFKSEVAVGSIKVEDAELPAIGNIIELTGVTKVSTRSSVLEDGKEFNWLVLE